MKKFGFILTILAISLNVCFAIDIPVQIGTVLAHPEYFKLLNQVRVKQNEAEWSGYRFLSSVSYAENDILVELEKKEDKPISEERAEELKIMAEALAVARIKKSFNYDRIVVSRVEFNEKENVVQIFLALEDTKHFPPSFKDIGQISSEIEGGFSDWAVKMKSLKYLPVESK